MSVFSRDGSGAVVSAELPGLPVRRGKVRDVFDLSAVPGHAGTLLVVATDRLSAFDHVLPGGVPGKGRVLTGLSNWWFDRLDVPDHRTGLAVKDVPLDGLSDADRTELAARSVVVKKCDIYPVECVARGFLAGSGWKEYLATQAVCGVFLRPGKRQSERLERPIFTPATKAEGGHDENIGMGEAEEIVGRVVAGRLRALTLGLYARAADAAERAGLILADTKFEFGVVPGEKPHRDGTPRIRLCDEALTPDSSRYWPADGYAPGGPQPSFDKQFVRDWLLQSGWDRESPPPALPPEVVEKTAEKYRECHRRLTGRDAP